MNINLKPAPFEISDLFEKYKSLLSTHIKHWGFIESKVSYHELLCKCDVVVSTADHEFFGVAMLVFVFNLRVIII